MIEKLNLPYTKVHVVYNENLCLPQHWAYAKIKTYSIQEEPFLHVDGDMYFPKPISEEILSSSLITQNREIGTGYYRSMMGRILKHPEIQLPQCIQESLGTAEIASYNMGIFGGHDLPFIKEFCQQAFNFLNDNQMNDPQKEYAKEECNILFEQVLFAVLADNSKRKIATIGRPMRDEGYTSYEFCNLTDYDNKSFFHILGGHKNSNAICYALERVLLTHYPVYFERIIELFPQNHPRLFSMQTILHRISTNADEHFAHFLMERERTLNSISRTDILKQEVQNTLFFEFANQDKTRQLDYTIRINPMADIYEFSTEEKKEGWEYIARWFTRHHKQTHPLCAAVILPGIDKYKNRVIPISALGKNVLTILKEDEEKSYKDMRMLLWRHFSIRLQKHPKTLKKYILKEIIYLAYNGIITIQQPNNTQTL